MLFNPQQVQPTQPIRFPGNATVAEFSLASTPTQILFDRSIAQNRRGLMVYNDGTAAALFSFGSSISATNFTAELLPGGWFNDNPNTPWQGQVMMRAKDNPTSVNVTEIILI